MWGDYCLMTHHSNNQWKCLCEKYFRITDIRLNASLRGNKMKRVLKTLGIVLGVLLLLFSFLWFNNYIGISKNSIEKDARCSSKIKDDWQVAMDSSSIMSAMVFYPEDKSDLSYQIYVNHPGLSFGYFFRGGGNSIEIERYIAEFTVEGCEDRAFISLNTQQVVKAEIDNGDKIEIINIDSVKPFVIVISKNIGSITFFDKNNNVIDTIKRSL